MRRSPSPIMGFVGSNGHGKTLAAMVMAVAPALRAGRQVVATCVINHPNARVLRSWRELVQLRDCLVLLDDISSQLPARESMRVPPQLIRTVNELRHSDVDVAWTAPNWSRADVALREVTLEVTVCRGLLPDWSEREQVVPPWYRLNAPRIGPLPHRWPSNRLFRFKTFDASAFDDFTEAKVKDVKPVARTWYWRPWHEECFLYRTLDFSVLMDHLDDAGVCVNCGGHRARHKCVCPREAPPGFPDQPEAVGVPAVVGDADLFRLLGR